MTASDSAILKLFIERNIAIQARNEALIHTALYELAAIRAKLEGKAVLVIRQEQMKTCDALEEDFIDAYLGADKTKVY